MIARVNYNMIFQVLLIVRSFSILNHIRSDRRTNLSPESIDRLVFIRMNAARDIEKFDAMACTDYWYGALQKQLADDPIGYASTTSTSYESKEDSIYFDESLLF